MLNQFCQNCRTEVSVVEYICPNCGNVLKQLPELDKSVPTQKNSQEKKNIGFKECPYCKEKVSNNSNICLQCGYQLIQLDKVWSMKITKTLLGIIYSLFPLIIISTFYTPSFFNINNVIFIYIPIVSLVITIFFKRYRLYIITFILIELLLEWFFNYSFNNNLTFM